MKTPKGGAAAEGKKQRVKENAQAMCKGGLLQVGDPPDFPKIPATLRKIPDSVAGKN